MNKTKQTFIFGFALFAAFFGAGNLILPPFLGFNSGPDWWLVTLGFILSTTIIPLLALLGHAKLQGTLIDFGIKVSPLFSLIFSLSIFAITIALPCPRTAAVTHEMAIAPFFGTSSLLTSIVYFVLAFVFVMNRNKVLDILGKYLTPIIAVILIAIILIGIFSPSTGMNPSILVAPPIVGGFLEGYQTYDAIAGLVTGGVVIISINNSKSNMSFKDKKTMIAKSGLIAMAGLLIIYAGLIFVGAIYNIQFDANISRTELLSGLAIKTLGNTGRMFLSVLVALACFTTAVAIIVSIADFFKVYYNQSQKAYLITAIICCLVGIGVGQMNVSYIIDLALPALMFIYPLTIALILLNILPDRYASQFVFRAVVLVTFIFSIPDFLSFLISTEKMESITRIIPFAKFNLGWVLPSVITFILVNISSKIQQTA